MTMTDPASPQLSPRLQQFQSEVDQLKVTGGRASPERVWMILGALAMLVGVVITFIAWSTTHSTKSTLEIADYNALGTFGLALTIAGGVVFLVMSSRRYFRYWLIRLIFEQRDQADRIAAGR